MKSLPSAGSGGPPSSASRRLSARHWDDRYSPAIRKSSSACRDDLSFTNQRLDAAHVWVARLGVRRTLAGHGVADADRSQHPTIWPETDASWLIVARSRLLVPVPRHVTSGHFSHSVR